jgi:YfiH family protein
MIRPPGWDGVAFTDRSEGDVRSDGAAREVVSESLGISHDWAVARQVHASSVERVSSPGDAGERDALWTTEPGLPVAVFTADCLGVVLVSPNAVGVAHAGWRGAASGVVRALRQEMKHAGHAPERAAVGPGIGPCCFEVGAEVAERFDERHVRRTTWSTTSVDLSSVVRDQLEGLHLWVSGACTLHQDGWYSHREDGTTERMAAIGWVT